MHRYLRAIGFSEITNKLELIELVKKAYEDAPYRSYTTTGHEYLYAEYCMEVAENLGICIRGQYDEKEQFLYDHYFPYLKGTGITSKEDVSVERHAEKESYAGVCDDINVGVSLIFYLQNVVSYLKYKNSDNLPVVGTTLTLSGLSCNGTIMMPIVKNERDKQKTKKAFRNRSQLLAAARQGDEDAIESLTLEDMDTYTVISKKIHKEDVFSLVDTYFMPYGVECDQYSVLGEIVRYKTISNSNTKEELFHITLSCNELEFDICINKKDLFGEPEVGRRFKGVVWLQGYINYPD